MEVIIQLCAKVKQLEVSVYLFCPFPEEWKAKDEGYGRFQ